VKVLDILQEIIETMKLWGQKRRIKYRKNQNARDNSKEEKILVVLD